MRPILIIDDDQGLAEPLTEYFKRYDLALTSATTPSEGLGYVASQSFELVILDVMLPQMDGFEVCKLIRKQSNIPIIMLTARGEVMDRVIGLELGADDYLPKPFEPRELVARIQNILKRSQQSSSKHEQDKILYEDFELDLINETVKVCEQPVELTFSEFQLIRLLAINPHITLTRDELQNELRGIDADLFSRAIDVQISRIRSKLKPTDYIKTVRNKGYRFVATEHKE